MEYLYSAQLYMCGVVGPRGVACGYLGRAVSTECLYLGIYLLHVGRPVYLGDHESRERRQQHQRIILTCLALGNV